MYFRRAPVPKSPLYTHGPEMASSTGRTLSTLARSPEAKVVASRGTTMAGLPLIVGKFHGDPVIMAAVGMLSGFCGTLMTPMAANFNIVPTRLLDLDEYAVIRVQIPTAIALLLVNTLIMNFFVFR